MMRKINHFNRFVAVGALFFLVTRLYVQQITVIGAGYVGLVISAVLADLGNKTTCVDVDKTKIDNLKNNIIPIFEPGLQEAIEAVNDGGPNQNLFFSHDVNRAIQGADIIFIAVGTPTDENGIANLDALKSAALTIAKNLNGYKIICIKSTVPIGTHKLVKEIIEKNMSSGSSFDIVSNPEFLREGAALQDLLTRNPIVIGAASQYARDVIKVLYQPLLDAPAVELILTDNITAETIKYAWNSFAAIKIGYVNEIAGMCQVVGADIFTVIRGMGLSDALLPIKDIVPGPGYGGSCLPKDTQAFVSLADSLGSTLYLVKAAIDSNNEKKRKNGSKIIELLQPPLKDKTVTLLGLSFKANTDDIRYSPALEIIPQLLEEGIHIKAYDPAAMENMAKIYPQITYCSSSYEALSKTDLIVILTEWEEFKSLDFERIDKVIHSRVILDTRYLLHRAGTVPQNYAYNN